MRVGGASNRSLKARLQANYLWRPCLNDPKDDMVLEVAVAGNADFIVTHNIRDFTGAERFDVRVVTPGWLLKNMGGSI